MASSSVPPRPPSRRTLLIGGIAAGVVLLVALVIVGSIIAVRKSQDAIIEVVFAPVLATSAPTSTNGSPVPTTKPHTSIYDSQADAHQDISNALALAKTDEKLVLIDFGADWCPDCVVLSRLLDSDSVKPYLDEHYVVVRVDVGQWDRNLDISKAYDDPIKQGIPAVVVLDPSGAVVTSTGGGELANARSSSEDDILSLLEQWAELQ